jgi:hypothetical protein
MSNWQRRDYTEEELQAYIKESSERGKPDAALYWTQELNRLRAERKNENA